MNWSISSSEILLGNPRYLWTSFNMLAFCPLTHLVANKHRFCAMWRGSQGSSGAGFGVLKTCHSYWSIYRSIDRLTIRSFIYSFIHLFVRSFVHWFSWVRLLLFAHCVHVTGAGTKQVTETPAAAAQRAQGWLNNAQSDKAREEEKKGWTIGGLVCLCERRGGRVIRGLLRKKARGREKERGRGAWKEQRKPEWCILHLRLSVVIDAFQHKFKNALCFILSVQLYMSMERGRQERRRRWYPHPTEPHRTPPNPMYPFWALSQRIFSSLVVSFLCKQMRTEADT